MSIWRILGGMTSTVLVAGLALGVQPPAVFGTRTVASAIEAGKKEGKLVILDATATWCAPCKSMDATTWVEPAVEKWIGSNAIAAQFDVDEDVESARAFNIAAMPTIIAVKNGVEFDRLIGYQSSEKLLGWLSGVQEGKTQAQQAEDPGLRERMRLSREKVRSGRVEDAFADYLWLWNNIEQRYPDLAYEKTDSLIVAFRDMTGRLPAAKDKLGEIRAALEPKAETDPKAADEFLSLCKAMREEPRIIAWFDAHKSRPNFKELWTGAYKQAEPQLILAGRWRDVGLLVDKPIDRMNAVWDASQKTIAEFEAQGRMPEVIVAEKSRYGAEATRLYVALLAADRDDEAMAVAMEATRRNPTPMMWGLLITKALDNDQARAVHLEWLKPELANTLDIEDAQKRIHQQLAKRGK